MFSLQNQNQVSHFPRSKPILLTHKLVKLLQAFATLTQISAKVTTTPGSFFRKKPQHKAKQGKLFLCSDSFLETVKNCDFAFAKHLNISALFRRPFLNNFNVSYVSNDTFFENKHGFAQDQLCKNIPTLIIQNSSRNVQIPQGFYDKLVEGLITKNKFTFNIQTRGFKTERSIQADLERNPPIINRLRNKLGAGTSEGGTKVPLTGTNTTDAEQLKKILSTEESGLSEGERQRLKIAFAEGYMSANTNGGKSGKASKYFRVVQQVLTIGLFLAIVITLMASASGSVFR